MTQLAVLPEQRQEMLAQVRAAEFVDETDCTEGDLYADIGVELLWGMVLLARGNAWHDDHGNVEAQIDFEIIGCADTDAFGQTFGAMWCGPQNATTLLHLRELHAEAVHVVEAAFAERLEAARGGAVEVWR